MHQVKVSHLYDAEGGIWSTNLDHDPEQVYEGLIRLMLYLPTNPNKCKCDILPLSACLTTLLVRYKCSLTSLLLMILDPELYIPTHR